MLTAIVRFSLRFRGVTLVLAAVLSAYGIYTLTRAKFAVFPEFAPPEVDIRVEAPGFSPEQAEMLITMPLEHAIAGVAGVQSVRSHSQQGLSAITVIFKPDSDIYRARQRVAERLSALSQPLPPGIKPFMSPLTSSAGTVLQVGLTSETRSLMDLRSIADWTVKPSLLAVPGVAQVQVYGGLVRQLQIRIRPERLVQYQLSIEEVAAAAEQATGLRSAGFVETDNQRMLLHTYGQSVSAQQLAAIVLRQQNGANVILGDVAAVTEGSALPIGAASVNGQPGIVMIVTLQYGGNTLDATTGLDQALAALGPMLAAQNIQLHPDLFRPATFIHSAIHNVLAALAIGGILVVIVLFLFLFNFRTAAISFTAIPLSLLAAITLMDRLGFSLNIMSLGGLAIAIGEVVDDAVIDVENIFRRLGENRRRPDPRPILQVVLDASIEVRSAVVYATFAVVLVFLPVLTLPGVAGRLFAPLGIAYIAAVLSSLLVALTVTPALCFLLLGRWQPGEKEPPVMRWSKRRYQKGLMRIEKHTRLVIAGVLFLIACGAATLPFLEGEFLPVIHEGSFIVHVTAIPGTSLEESLRLGDRVSADLLKLPYVDVVSQKTGRAEQGASIRGIASSEINVGLKPELYSQFKPSAVRKLLARYPGTIIAVNTFLKERIGETISGYTAPVVVHVFGNDLDLIDQKGRDIAGILKAMPAAADVTLQAAPQVPQIMVRLRPEALSQWGFRPVQVLDAISTMFQGRIVGQVYEQDQVVDVTVILDPGERRAVAQIGLLPLRSASGIYVRLADLAEISEVTGRYQILHNDGRRVQTVTCGVTGRNVDAFVADARKRIEANVALPAGAYIEFAGLAESEAQSVRKLLLHSLLTAAGIILMVSVILKNNRNVLLLLCNLPFALVGGVLAVYLSGGLLSLGAMVGFVTVYGITMRNGIMMLSHFQHLVSAENMKWGRETAMRGALERLAPILMTAFVTGLGLLPLALGRAAPGREIEGRMAIAILGGLITSTLLNLLVLPALSVRFGRFDKMDEKTA